MDSDQETISLLCQSLEKLGLNHQRYLSQNNDNRGRYVTHGLPVEIQLEIIKYATFTEQARSLRYVSQNLNHEIYKNFLHRYRVVCCDGPEIHSPKSYFLVHKHLYNLYDAAIGNSIVRNTNLSEIANSSDSFEAYLSQRAKERDINNYLDDPAILPSSLGFGNYHTKVYLEGRLKLIDKITLEYHPHTTPMEKFIFEELPDKTTLRFFFTQLISAATALLTSCRSHNVGYNRKGWTYEVIGAPQKLRLQFCEGKELLGEDDHVVLGFDMIFCEFSEIPRLQVLR
ncbi:hypothetical protein AA313_de0206720 [Arthrobotrys entomopaga]|nr:hypothetical protein AA313_de0206720 [Arthrobotrys entomopaga]